MTRYLESLRQVLEIQMDQVLLEDLETRTGRVHLEYLEDIEIQMVQVLLEDPAIQMDRRNLAVQ
jgi:hypothetical protein